MRSQKGFTLVELMIVVAIVGILAAVAIPAYLDVTKKARVSEVLSAMDAIAQGITEYHAAQGCFPDSSYNSNNLARISELYANLDIVNGSDSNEIMIQASFKANLNLTKDDAGSGNLVMGVTYDSTGYSKRWDLSLTTIDSMYIPKGGGL